MISKRLNSLPKYAFAQINDQIKLLQSKGIKIIDFGVGDPKEPTPEFIREAAKKAIDEHASSGYPSYNGSKNFREKVAEYLKRRSNIDLDPETEISSTIGSKEAVFNFPEAVINPGDYVLMPNPGYPPYKSGTIFAEGIPYQYPLLPENDFFPDFSKIPEEVLQKAKILWLNYPNSPTGKTASKNFYEKAIKFAQKHNILIASDECYLDIYYQKKPISILEISKKNIIAFHSLSKRSNMTGWRIGFVCGDADIVQTFKKLKPNIDSGTPDFIQDAAAKALGDDIHVQKSRDLYIQKKEILLNAFKKINLEIHEPESTFYIWQKVPKNYTSIEFAKKLLDSEIGIIVTPGELISDEINNFNPGKDYVRFALVPSLEQIKSAAEKLEKLKV
ncbi:hypothetical protein A2483_02845 [Candidatus Peregrinibacteria bacterium RIFOXYC2_FULL_33_13]|nr:MAG: hypothetical protein A2483_02845 [Candidatus Peregrinibacteria bacterium RIFOXYC2_FULL_33_13]